MQGAGPWRASAIAGNQGLPRPLRRAARVGLARAFRRLAARRPLGPRVRRVGRGSRRVDLHRGRCPGRASLGASVEIPRPRRAPPDALGRLGCGASCTAPRSARTCADSSAGHCGAAGRGGWCSTGAARTSGASGRFVTSGLARARPDENPPRSAVDAGRGWKRERLRAPSAVKGGRFARRNRERPGQDSNLRPAA